MHGPHLTDAFTRYVEHRFPPTVTVDKGDRQVLWPARRLLGVLTQCSDPLPNSICAELDIRPGSSYAAAAKRLLREERIRTRR